MPEMTTIAMAELANLGGQVKKLTADKLFLQFQPRTLGGTP